MKQLLQSVSTGEAKVVDVPVPGIGAVDLLVRVHASLISAGTEKSVVEFAEKNLIQKAMSRPDLVKQVIDKANREGYLSTYDAVKNRLDTDMALGYSNAGEVIAVGNRVDGFKVGDRVACCGGGFASHAELVRIPRTLVAKIPERNGEAVSYEDASFVTVASIALQGIRLAELQLGEVVVVIGLGLIGQIAVQLAKAAGCVVLGMDLNAGRCRLAEKLGCDAAAENPGALESLVSAHTRSAGADAVIITAATKSNSPVELAGEVARDRGRVIAVGAVGLELPRKPYYMKELDFRVSRSYGPGRYDVEYEEKGNDYPIAFVRWTEQRNMEAVLQLLAAGKLDFQALITHRFAIEQAEKGYELISGKTGEDFLGVVLTYPNQPSLTSRVELATGASVAAKGRVALGMLGAGNFTTATLLPALKGVEGVDLVGICGSAGVNARSAGSRYGFKYCSTSEQELISDPAVNTVAITTRHSIHARQVVEAWKAGKNVFCEKPLCLTEEELAEIVRTVQETPNSGQMLMVGFNRRFAPLVQEMKKFISAAGEPIVINCRVNAGYIPASHWTQDPEQGGRRILGEVCHFVDLATFLTGHQIAAVEANLTPNLGRYCDDNLVATLRFEDGSLANITYVANGDKGFSKERFEAFGGGAVAVLDDYRTLELVRGGTRRMLRARLRQDKGHHAEWVALSAAIRMGGTPPIPFAELVNSSLASLKLVESAASGERVSVDSRGFMASALAATEAGL